MRSTPHAHQHALPQVLGAPDCLPYVRALPREAALGGDDDSVIGVQCLADQILADVRPVRIRRIDEVDVELGEPAQDPQRLVAVGGLAPHPLAGDAHRAEAEAMDGEVVGDLDGRHCVGAWVRGSRGQRS